jgi:hypothetical protein
MENFAAFSACSGGTGEEVHSLTELAAYSGFGQEAEAGSGDEPRTH